MDTTRLAATLLEAVPANEAFGIEVASAVDGSAEVRMSVTPWMTNVIGSLHSSGLIALVDATGFDTGNLLDIALGLVAAEGPGALTMAALARAAGAPSGSVYHRFESLAVLRGSVWLRAVGEFQVGFLAALGGSPAIDGCAAAARHVVAWSRADPGAARVLMEGPRAFGENEWDSPVRARSRKLRRELERALAGPAEALGHMGEEGRRRVALATVDMPLGLVRRRSPGCLDRTDEELVEAAARAILGL